MTIDPRVTGRVLKRIEKETFERIGRIAAGTATDFADYRERVGYVRALNDVTTWFEEAQRDMEKAENR